MRSSGASASILLLVPNTYETRTLCVTDVEVQYRRSPKREWKVLSNLDIIRLERLEYRVWNRPLTLLSLVVFVASLFQSSPTWFFGLLLTLAIVVVAGSIGPKRTRLSLRTNQLERIPVLDSNDPAEIEEVYARVHYLVFHRFPKVEYVSEFDAMVARIQQGAKSRKCDKS